MNNEWHPFPGGENPSDADPSGADPTPGYGQSSTPPTPTAAGDNHGEDTLVLSPSLGASRDIAPTAKRRTGMLSAAVLAGALVVGGVAGVGGAAAYDSMKSDSSTSQPGDITAGATKSDNASPTSNSTSSTAVESVAQKVLPSVVQINVTGTNEAGSGSGIVLDKDGTILTNNHVVAVAGKGGSIRVNFNDGRSARATIVGTDPVTDLAVIKAEGVSDLTPAEIGSSADLRVGQGVVAIGSPYGLGATVTSGIVSALDRAVSVNTSEGGGGSNPFGRQPQQPSQGADQSTTYPAIQTDAAINPGNSGGPLVNLAGQVIGINSSIRTSDSSSSTGQGGSIGLGFAIPMDEVLPIVNQLKSGDTATHARLGVSVADNETSSDAQTGAKVKTLEKGGSADQAGLQVGDVITKVGDQLIDGSDALVATIRGHRPGDDVRITLIRGGRTQTVDARLGSDENSSTS